MSELCGLLFALWLLLAVVGCGAEEQAGAPVPEVGPAANSRESRGQIAAALRFELPEALPGELGYALRHSGLDYADPSLAISTAGELCLVWLSFDGVRDEVLAAVFGGEEGRWGRPFRVSREPGVYFPPRAAADPGGGCYFAWSARVGDEHRLLGRAFSDGELGAIEILRSGEGSATEPALAATPTGELWLVWEDYRGRGFDLVARRRAAEGWGSEIRLTSQPRSDLQPSLAVAADGTPWVAWMSWREGEYWNGNYEIYATPLRAELQSESSSSRDSNSTDSPLAPTKISRSPHVDMFPELLRVGSRLALTWTEAYFPPRSIDELHTAAYGRWTDKVYQLAWLEAAGDAWSAPETLRVTFNEKQGPLVYDRATPIAPADDSGSKGLWLLFGDLVSRSLMDRSWALKLLRVEDGAPSEPVDLSRGATGPGDVSAALWRDGELWVAEVLSLDERAENASGRSWLRVHRVAPGQLPPERPIDTRELRPRKEVISGLRVDSPSRLDRPEVMLGSQRWAAYFGNLHHHSDLSRDRRGLNGTPIQAYRSLFDVAELDFGGISDHVEWLSRLDWWRLRKTTELWNKPGRFVTFPSYEWTSFEYGHKNVFFPSREVADGEVTFSSFGKTPDDLWAFLADRPAITIPHHPSHSIDKPTDWSFRNDRYQRLAEIFQARGSYEYDGAPYQRTDLHPAFNPGHSIQDALAQGHKLGIIASPDHGGGMGLAGVWAPELSRESIFEALHARRSFGTTGAKMALFLSINGAPQGSEIVSRARGRAVRGSVRGSRAGLDVDLVGDGETLKSWHFDGDEAFIEWKDDSPIEGTRYYYLRARQSDGHLGWTSPIWVSGE